MGGSSWSDDFYSDRVSDRAKTGTPTFDYDHKVKTGVVAAVVNDRLNIKGKIRESRDSDAHPESTAIGVIFDVTGSMSSVPSKLQEKLPQLMGLLLRKGYIKDPQILFGAVGDYFADRIPLQIGQFESGIEMDEDVTTLVLEGGGGGSYEESYQNALYFFAHKTSIDCFEKRGKKGYLFLIGDEKPYPVSRKNELAELIGDSVETDLSIKDIISAVTEKYNVFFIIPKGTSHYGDPILKNCWAELLGAQNVIMLEDPSTVCETIGITIGLLEGTCTADGMATDLKDLGAGTAIIKSVTTGLDTLAKNVSLVKVGTGSLPEKTGRSTTTTRL